MACHLSLERANANLKAARSCACSAAIMVAVWVLAIAALVLGGVVTSSADGGALQTCLAPSNGFPLLPGGDNVLILPCSKEKAACQAFNCTECIGQLQCVANLDRSDVTCSPCAPIGPNYDLAALALLIGLALLGVGIAQVLCLSARNGFDPSTCRSNHRTGCSAICGTPCSDPWPQAADASGDGCSDGPGYSVMVRQHAPPVILGASA